MVKPCGKNIQRSRKPETTGKELIDPTVRENGGPGHMTVVEPF